MSQEQVLLQQWRELPAEQQKQAADYIQALHSHRIFDHLKTTLLDAIERQHPNYTDAIVNALLESTTETNNNSLNANEFESWLTAL